MYKSSPIKMSVRTLPRTLVAILLVGALMNTMFDLYSVLSVERQEGDSNNYVMTFVGDVEEAVSVSGIEGSSNSARDEREPEFDSERDPMRTETDYDIRTSPDIPSLTKANGGLGKVNTTSGNIPGNVPGNVPSSQKYSVYIPSLTKKGKGQLGKNNTTSGNIPGNVPSNFSSNVPSSQKYSNSNLNTTTTLQIQTTATEMDLLLPLTLDPNISIKDSKRVKTYSGNLQNKNSYTHYTSDRSNSNLQHLQKPSTVQIVRGTTERITEMTAREGGEKIPSDRKSDLIHRKYWEAIKQHNGSGSDSGPASRATSKQNESEIPTASSPSANERLSYYSESEKELLEPIFNRDSFSLWSQAWQSSKSKQRNGYGEKYDYRVITQLLWDMEASNLRPDIYNQTLHKTKKISLRDSFKWWNYSGEKYLSCAGSFDRKCEMVDGEDPNSDAVITVRDAFHTTEHYVPREMYHIYFILESPFASPNVRLLRHKDLMASYWRGADIQTPYSKWAYYDTNITQHQTNQSLNYAAGKTKMVAVFMSNCGGNNNRLGYVRELEKHIQVDVYGSCGSLRCPRQRGKTCLEMLRKDYRFYLAFENANCRDYITEKFFVTALQNDVVPVVLGAHPDDYAAVAPQNSYIHVEQFESPKSLATYLNDLARSDAAYNNYFRWKGTGEFVNANFLCRVCGMLHFTDAVPPLKRTSVIKWTATTNGLDPMCLSADLWYWQR